MSQLSEKYLEIYILAQRLGARKLVALEGNGHITISGMAPTRYVADQVWNKLRSIDPSLSQSTLTLDLSVSRQDIYGEYEVRNGDTLSAIVNDVTCGKLSIQQLVEANRAVLRNSDHIRPGQRLTIPNF